jgi:predicted nucleotidyltransferase
MNHEVNIARIKIIYEALGELGDKVAFVGGATVSLYADRIASETRPTEDVDVVIELVKYTDFANIENELRNIGFVNDKESGVICRFIIHGIVVDVMPTNQNVLGFKNRWYPEGFKQSIGYKIDDQVTVRIFSPPYFMASKLDAFKDRGKDGRFSKDFEDIVYVLNNRTTIWDEMNAAPEGVRLFLKEEFKKLRNENYLQEWLSGHLEYNEQSRVKFIIDRMRKFTS